MYFYNPGSLQPVCLSSLITLNPKLNLHVDVTIILICSANGRVNNFISARDHFPFSTLAVGLTQVEPNQSLTLKTCSDTSVFALGILAVYWMVLSLLHTQRSLR